MVFIVKAGSRAENLLAGKGVCNSRLSLDELSGRNQDIRTGC